MSSNFIKKLFPGIEPYYTEALLKHASIIELASNQFKNFIEFHKNNPDELQGLMGFVKEIYDYEKEADNIASEFVKNVQKAHSWQLPFDADQLLDLMNKQDDIIDEIKSYSEKMSLYAVKCHFNEDFVNVAILIHDATKEILNINMKINNLHKNSVDIRTSCENVDKLESQADKIKHDGLRNLFSKSSSFKDEEIRYMEKNYEMMEEVMDLCEDVTKMVSNILVRNI